MRIYIAHNYGRRRNESPETLQKNVDDSNRIAVEIIKKGHTPINPLNNHYIHLMANGSIPESTFMNIGQELVELSEALLIATEPVGKNCGVQDEINLAKKLRKTIYYSLEEIP